MLAIHLTRARAARPSLARLLAALIITATVATTACAGGDSSTGPTNGDPTGLYSLRTVSGAAIPTQVYRGPLFGLPDMIVRVTGGELTLQDDGRFEFAMDFTVIGPGGEGTTTAITEGDYELRGGQIELVVDGEDEVTAGTLRGGAVTLPIDIIGTGQKRPCVFRIVP